MADLLAVSGLSAGYGRAVVLSDIGFRLGEGEALAVLGRNGVGKTTLIDSIVGVTRRFGGSLTLGGREIGALAPETRAALGIGWVPQERNIFRSLTVEENITAVARPGPWTLDRIFGLFPRLKERRTPVRRFAVRRRAADAGDRPGAGDQSAAAAARRADRGPGADHHRGTAARAAQAVRRGGHGGHRRRAAGAQDPADHRPRDRARPRPHRVRSRPAPRCSPTVRRSNRRGASASRGA